MIIKGIFSILSAAAILLLSSCNNPTSDEPWLIAIGCDTISSTDMSLIWSELNSSQREDFLAHDNPSLNFVESYLRKLVLLKELDTRGYLQDPSLIAYGEAWLRIENAILIGERLLEVNTNSISSDDLESYRLRSPRHVWFTTEPDSPQEVVYSKIDMRALPEDMFEHLDTLQPGSSGADIYGANFRLDSIASFEVVSRDDMNSDSLNALAISRQRTTMFMIRNVQNVDASIDSVALKNLSLNLSDVMIAQEYIVIHSEYRDWTAQDLQYEIDFLDAMMPTQPNSFEWLCFLADGLLLHSFLLDYTTELYPETLDSLQMEKEIWLNLQAMDIMYRMQATDQVIVTDTDIEEQFGLLEEPFMFEERRILQTAILPEGRLPEFDRSVAHGTSTDLIVQLEPLERLSDSNLTPRISRPMRLVEVPAGLGENVFQLLPSDTTDWKGPYPIDEADGFIFFRLAKIVPAREAEMEEITFDLTSMARKRLESEAIDSWLLELNEKYNASLNSDALNNLPLSPSEW